MKYPIGIQTFGQIGEERYVYMGKTDNYVYIFEFKFDGTVEEALKQIYEKGYATPCAAGSRTLYKIGVNFSSETGTVEGWKPVI